MSLTETDKLIIKAGIWSVAVSIAVFAAKLTGYTITGSQAVLSDALESIVNIVASAFALFILRYSAAPADKCHPYGHGRSEYFSAAFEGGMIFSAALLIMHSSARALVRGTIVTEAGMGVLFVGGAGLVNLALGLALYKVGKKHNSIVLTASAKHILSDFWTSLAAITGLVIVKFSGLNWVDPVLALSMAGYLGFTGYKIVRKSIGALLDEEDTEMLNEIQKAFSFAQKTTSYGIIGVHRVRSQKFGRLHLIDAHILVPQFWDVKKAHDTVNAFEKDVLKLCPFEGEIHFHIDPCLKAYCKACDVENCPIRQAPFQQKIDLSLEELKSFKNTAA